jgi:hypothetical protein
MMPTLVLPGKTSRCISELAPEVVHDDCITID